MDTCDFIADSEVLIHTGTNLHRPDVVLSDVTEKTRVVGISI